MLSRQPVNYYKTTAESRLASAVVAAPVTRSAMHHDPDSHIPLDRYVASPHVAALVVHAIHMQFGTS